ncbi:MAG: hypothetical protein ACLFTI_11525 [Anaerolineales bacterium]
MRALMDTIAQEWIAEGRRRGGIYTTREAIFELLDVRFGKIPPSVAATLAEFHDLPHLKALHRRAATAETIEEFEREFRIGVFFKTKDLMDTIAQEWSKEGQRRSAIYTKREAIFELIDVRFGKIPPSVAAALAEIHDLPRLKALHRQAATAETIEEFEGELG